MTALEDDPESLDPPRAPRRPKAARWWRVARAMGSIMLAGLAIYVVAGRTDEISGFGTYLEKIDYSWVLLAFSLEIVSQMSFALIQRKLALSGGVPMSSFSLFGITLAGYSINSSLPAGSAWATYFAFRQYRRLGADVTLSAWMMGGLLLVSGLTLAILATVGLAIAVTTGSGSFGIADTIVSVVFGMVVLIGLAGLLLYRRGTLEHAMVRAVRLLQRVAHRPAGDPSEVAGEIARRLGAVRPSRSAAFVVLGWALANWLADLSVLIVSYKAVGVTVPWSGILLAYGAGQLAANLPITPGGLGVVEGSLIVALVAFGGSQKSTVAAVLLYRIISFWILLPLGWLSWLGIHLAERKVLRSADGGVPNQTAVDRIAS